MKAGELKRVSHAIVDILRRKSHILGAESDIFEYGFGKELAFRMLHDKTNDAMELFSVVFVGGLKTVDHNGSRVGSAKRAE